VIFIIRLKSTSGFRVPKPFFYLAEICSGTISDHTKWVTDVKIEINVLGAQAHFPTAQQLFSTSYDMKKQTCCISKIEICMYF